MGYLDKKKKEQKKQLALWILTFIILIISLFGIITTNGRFVDYVISYRPLYLYISIILFISSIYLLNLNTCLILLLCIVINFGQIASKSNLFEEVYDPNEIWTEPIIKKIALTKINGNKTSYVKINDYLRENNPDYIVALNAVDIDFIENLKLNYGNFKVENNIALFSKDEFIESGYNKENNSVWARFMTNNGVKYAIIVTNQEKNYNLNLSDQVAEMTNRFDEPVILVGGFNITPWSYKSLPYFESSFKTNILDGNYPSHLINLLKKPMDYIYTHDGIDIINQEIGEDNGSRYLPVLSTISIRPI